jgi:hypothetical protein
VALMAEERNANAVARAAMAAIAVRSRSMPPPPNDRDPRRVTAHLGTYKIEAEYPAGRADANLTIDRDGALVLKATVEPVWQDGRRAGDRIEILEAHGDAWFVDFLSHAPSVPEAAADGGEKPALAAQRQAAAKPKAAAKSAAKPKRGKAASRKPAAGKAARGKTAKGASAKGRAAKAGSRARPARAKTNRRGRR